MTSETTRLSMASETTWLSMASETTLLKNRRVMELRHVMGGFLGCRQARPGRVVDFQVVSLVIDSQVVSLAIDSQDVSLVIDSRVSGPKIDFFIVKKIVKNIFSSPEKTRKKSGKTRENYRKNPCIVLAKYEKYLTERVLPSFRVC